MAACLLVLNLHLQGWKHKKKRCCDWGQIASGCRPVQFSSVQWPFTSVKIDVRQSSVAVVPWKMKGRAGGHLALQCIERAATWLSKGLGTTAMPQMFSSGSSVSLGGGRELMLSLSLHKEEFVVHRQVEKVAVNYSGTIESCHHETRTGRKRGRSADLNQLHGPGKKTRQSTTSSGDTSMASRGTTTVGQAGDRKRTYRPTISRPDALPVPVRWRATRRLGVRPSQKEQRLRTRKSPQVFSGV